MILPIWFASWIQAINGTVPSTPQPSSPNSAFWVRHRFWKSHGVCHFEVLRISGKKWCFDMLCISIYWILLDAIGLLRCTFSRELDTSSSVHVDFNDLGQTFLMPSLIHHGLVLLANQGLLLSLVWTREDLEADDVWRCFLFEWHTKLWLNTNMKVIYKKWSKYLEKYEELLILLPNNDHKHLNPNVHGTGQCGFRGW